PLEACRLDAHGVVATARPLEERTVSLTVHVAREPLDALVERGLRRIELALENLRSREVLVVYRCDGTDPDRPREQGLGTDVLVKVEQRSREVVQRGGVVGLKLDQLFVRRHRLRAVLIPPELVVTPQEEQALGVAQ